MADEWLTPEERAKEWKVSVKTLANWRSARIGPPYSKINGSVRYSRATSDRWAAEREMQPRRAV